ncbi:unannotated protein [freshwater metagenome]|uniref:Unannotated protein n=1 Tax=freshwater metagenome TaxID=449393 RepID=A0A6J7L750_9ZZZZ
MVNSLANSRCASLAPGLVLTVSINLSISALLFMEKTLSNLGISASSLFNQYWKNSYALVICGSNQIEPPAVLPNLLPSALAKSGTVSAWAAPPSTLRIRSSPATIFPH